MSRPADRVRLYLGQSRDGAVLIPHEWRVTVDGVDVRSERTYGAWADVVARAEAAADEYRRWAESTGLTPEDKAATWERRRAAAARNRP